MATRFHPPVVDRCDGSADGRCLLVGLDGWIRDALAPGPELGQAWIVGVHAGAEAQDSELPVK
jgi:hypothetical protein